MIAGLVAMGMAAAIQCRDIGEYAQVRFDPVVGRPGDRLALRYTFRNGPDGDKPVPAYCVTAVRVRGDAVVANGGIRIKAKARAGSQVTVSARIGGQSVTRSLTVVGRDQQVLTGKWGQRSAQNCNGKRLAELIFTTEGSYSVTFPEHMIETMTSGGGRYRWDPASGALELGRYKGIARRDGGTLVIEGIDMDAVAPVLPPGHAAPPPCRITLAGG